MVWNYLFSAEGENRFDTQLLEGIKEKSNEKVEASLGDVKNLCTAVDSTGASLLHYAAQFGNETVTQLLLKLGAKVDLQDQKGQTPLILATKGEHEETIRVILEHDADIYLADKNGVSALQLAIQETLILPVIIDMFLSQIKIDCSESKEIARKLLKVNCPLYIAVRLQNVEVVKFMLSEGSPVDAADPKTNQTALHVAVQNQDAEMVQLLVDRGANVNALDLHKQTPLSLIRTFEETKILEILVNDKTDLTTCTEEGFMQIYWVLALGTSEAVKIAVQSKVDLQAKDSVDRTVIHYLANNVNPGIVDALRQWVGETGKYSWEKADSVSVDWNAKDRKGRTALHNAMAAGNADFVWYLMSKSVDVNVKTDEGVTPFFEVLESTESTLEQRVKCVERVMENGAYPDVEIERYLEIYNTKSAINRDFPLLQPVLAHLVLRQAKGERISEKIFESIACHPKLKDYVAACREELDQMKKAKIDHCLHHWKPVTLFDFLADGDRKSNNYGKDYNYSKLNKLLAKHDFDSYYSRTLRERVSRLFKHYPAGFAESVFVLIGYVLVLIAIFATYLAPISPHIGEEAVIKSLCKAILFPVIAIFFALLFTRVLSREQAAFDYFESLWKKFRADRPKTD